MSTVAIEILEKEWQRIVVDLAKQLGWTRIYHTHDSRRSAHGFPDLVLVRERVIFVELKREKGLVTDEQLGWIEALNKAGAEVHLWRPSQLEWAAQILTERRPCP